MTADRTTTHTNGRGGARPGAGRPRLYDRGDQITICLGTGDKSRRVRTSFKELKNRLGFERRTDCEFLDFLLQQVGTAQLNL